MSEQHNDTTKAIMLQGTCSNAGKSVLCSALCRILLQDGFSVAPFKAQNMALNSFVTRRGEEMGRAQVVQAQACRLDPDVRMNPILLKPSGGVGCQVVLMGKPVGNMSVDEYIQFKAEAFRSVAAAYDELASEFDVIVLEGAGSPAEINLKQHDIVNMRMAQHADASVLLVGDIDKGGVYASFVGTVELLAETERRQVGGFLVNKFRGDAAQLEPAHDFMQRRTGKPVLGVVPYLEELGLPEEDSVEFKAGRFDHSSAQVEGVEIALIDLPHISNFTDFDPLRLEPDVALRVVRDPDELSGADAVILPGTKNVMADLESLRQHGFAERLRSLDGAVLVGVCGGFQMLGQQIHDPHGVESASSSIDGLSMLPITTTLAQEKTLLRAAGTHVVSGLPVHGYEIHHGVTDLEGAREMIRRSDGQCLGASSPDGTVWGTYLHGVFDDDQFRRWFVDRLRERKGLTPLGAVQAHYDLEPAFERLAETVRAHVKLDQIYELMGL